MSKLSLEITRCDVKEKSNYFILVQLDETEYPSKLLRTQKYLTEIDYTTEFPSFQKNFFVFSNVALGNKLILRIGLFTFNNVNIITKNQKLTNNIPSKLLFDNSTLIGSSDIIISEKFLDELRSKKFVETDRRLIHPEINKKETGHIFFKLKCKSETLDAKIYEDNKEIEKNYYDPFLTDKKEIGEKFKKIIILNEEKQFELEKMQKKLDDINNKVNYAARDKESVKKALQLSEEENNLLTKNLKKIQNYDEIHIEIDLLSQSPQGIEIIEKKYAVLLAQLSIQKQIKFENENKFKEIETVVTKINIIKNRFDLLKKANKELKFNIKLQNDMLPLITTYQEKIKNNDKLINNYKNNIKDIISIRKQNSTLNNEELEKRIVAFEKERKKLEEKKLQLNLFIDVNYKDKSKTFNELQEPFYKIIGNDPTMNKILNESEITVIQKNNQTIMNMNETIKNLSKKISDFETSEREKKEKGIVIDPGLIVKRNNLKELVNNSENKEKYLLDEISKNKDSFNQAKEMLKDKIAYYDEIIERELKYARLQKYEEDVYNNNQRYYYENFDY